MSGDLDTEQLLRHTMREEYTMTGMQVSTIVRMAADARWNRDAFLRSCAVLNRDSLAPELLGRRVNPRLRLQEVGSLLSRIAAFSHGERGRFAEQFRREEEERCWHQLSEGRTNLQRLRELLAAVEVWQPPVARGGVSQKADALKMLQDAVATLGSESLVSELYLLAQARQLLHESDPLDLLREYEHALEVERMVLLEIVDGDRC